MTVPVPTWRLAIVAAVLAPILLALPGNGWTRLVVVNGILLGIALVDAAVAPSPAKIPIERTVPGVLSLGAEGEVAWAIVNPTSRAARSRSPTSWLRRFAPTRAGHGCASLDEGTPRSPRPSVRSDVATSTSTS